MPFPPSIARALASLYLFDDELDRLSDLHYQDAGHGYDPFGLHPDFVGLGHLIAGPLYDKWFRVISRGHASIPEVGPAVLAANHSGSIPIDGAMIWMDVQRHTHPPRVARAIADHFVPSLPWVGTLFARSGMIGGSRGNTRVLLENGELLLIFPEGTPGIIKPWKERYQLRKFRVGHAELAIRHSAPIIPVGVIGAEEQLPLIHASKRLGKPFGVPEVPIPAVPFPLPVRYRIFYGDPIPVHEQYSPDDADDPEVVRKVAAQVQAAVDVLLKQGLKERKGVFA